MRDSGLLAQGLTSLALSFTRRQLEALETYRAELERWNRSYGFVKAGADELVVRHFLDSLAGLPRIAGLSPRRDLIDVGSGAGFPGIPLAIFMEDSSFVLLERSAKRAAFLRNVVLLLGLSNVRVEEKQLKEVQESFDLAIFRAFTPLWRELDGLRRVLRPGGHLVSYKGRREKILEELARARLPNEQVELLPLQVPFLEAERHLVILRV